MRIAYIPGAFFPDPGGAQVQVHNLANIFNKKNFNIDVLLLNKTNIKNHNYNILYLNKLIVNFVFYFDYYLKIDLTFLLVFYLSRVIKLKKYNAWHFIFLNYKSLLLIKSLKKLNQNIIVTFQGADIQINKKIFYGNRLDLKYDLLLKKILPMVNIFTAISKNIYLDLIKLGVNKNLIFSIPNGIPLNKFIKIKKEIIKKKTSKIRLITVARYAEKKKGFDLIPKFLKQLVKSQIEFEWTIIGKNTSKLLENNEIYKLKKKFNIYENFFINNESLFPSKKIISKYLEADVYINLSRIESFGITFIEALSSNLPVISFDTKGANEIVINNYNGFIIKNNQVIKFVKKIEKLTKNKSFFKSKPLKSAKKYDFENLKKEYFKLYQVDL